MHPAETTTEPPANESSAYGCLSWSLVLHAMGVVLALSLDNWVVMAYVPTLIGTILMALLYGWGKLPPDSPQRARAVRSANVLIGYGAVVTLAVLVSEATGDGEIIWFAYLCLAPVFAGIGARASLLGIDQMIARPVARVLVIAVPPLLALGAPLSSARGQSLEITLLVSLTGVVLLALSLFCAFQAHVVLRAALVALAATLVLANLNFGAHAWLEAAGDDPQACRHLRTQLLGDGRKYSDRTIATHTYRCGGRDVEYRRDSGVAKPPGDVLVADRTGVSEVALTPGEVPGNRGVLWTVNLAAVLLALLAVTLVPGRRREG
ncbi:hypothetical protein [Spirillospora sp. CA-294931]|uniref:hypothetical protein n=1 Tax=Spirillospora sp. CA-294931 TaxID=3240042 RepID=UPI003D8B54F8